MIIFIKKLKIIDYFYSIKSNLLILINITKLNLLLNIENLYFFSCLISSIFQYRKMEKKIPSIFKTFKENKNENENFGPIIQFKRELNIITKQNNIYY